MSVKAKGNRKKLSAPPDAEEMVVSWMDRKARVKIWTLMESAGWAKATRTDTGPGPVTGLGAITGLSLTAVAVEVGVEVDVLVKVVVRVGVTEGVAVAAAKVMLAA